MELDQSGFDTQAPTVFAGNVGDYIIQVTKHSARLMQGVTLLQELPLEVSPVLSCSVADPYVLVTYENGHTSLLTLQVDSLGGATLLHSKPELQHVSKNK